MESKPGRPSPTGIDCYKPSLGWMFGSKWIGFMRKSAGERDDSPRTDKERRRDHVTCLVVQQSLLAAQTDPFRRGPSHHMAEFGVPGSLASSILLRGRLRFDPLLVR